LRPSSVNVQKCSRSSPFAVGAIKSTVDDELLTIGFSTPSASYFGSTSQTAAQCGI